MNLSRLNLLRLWGLERRVGWEILKRVWWIIAILLLIGIIIKNVKK